MDPKLRQKLIDYTLRLLARRPYSRSEIERKLNFYLLKKNIPAQKQKIEEIITYLEEHNFVNDVDFAKWYVAQREEFHPKSKKEIAYELTLKGIERSLIEKALKDYNEIDAIKKIAAKKKDYPREKLINYLLGHGFSWDNIKDALK